MGKTDTSRREPYPPSADRSSAGLEAEKIVAEFASAFLQQASTGGVQRAPVRPLAPDSMYRALVEQMPAVIFIAYLDQLTTEAYVSPQIESALGFSQEEWLGDPIRWYQHIHPEDKERWSLEAAELVQGRQLRSVYRVFARDGRVLWFHCEAKIVKHEDGRPWFFLGVGFDVTELKRTEETLKERTEALHVLSTKLFQAQDQERRRIARELHDGLGQYLIALKLNFDTLALATGASKVAGQAAGQANDLSGVWAESKEMLERCISETRTISYLLHPPLLDEVGLASAAKWYVDGFAQRSGIRASLDIPPEFDRLPKPAELAIFRVLQESLTNVHRHSSSDAVEVSLSSDGSEANLVVRDHGCGIEPQVLKKFRDTGAHAGVGLAGMRQRVNELGGRFEISSDRGGTIVKVTVPILLEIEPIVSNVATT